jgi:predicted metal-dependent phosphoesterase TrpH
MPGFDLHTHSNCSDGTLDPERVATMAAERGLDGIALTDHDTTAGLDRARAAAPDGFDVLAGCELSAEYGQDPVHVLAIAFDVDEPSFARVRRTIRDERVNRARRTVERLRELGAEVDFDRVAEVAGGASIGRPHIAQAMIEAGVVPDVPTAFSLDWIGTGGRAYVPKQAVTPVRAVHLIRGAGGVAVLAHPSKHAGARPVPEELIREMAAAGLAGLEIEHPDQPDAEQARWRPLAAELDLVPTGGSDDHGGRTEYRLGAFTTSAEALRKLLARAPDATGGRDPRDED